MADPVPTRTPTNRGSLSADCSRCAGLCCVAPGFTRSADFAIDKPPGQPCPHLAEDFACSIHQELRPRGFPGCATYDCFGAGQHVTQVVYGGESWLEVGHRVQVFAVFDVVRGLHELLWYLCEAFDLADGPLRDRVASALGAVADLTGADPEELAAVDVDQQRATVVPLLREVSAAVRFAEPGAGLAGADLVGADLRSRPLRGAELRGALLLGADLRGADLTLTDLTGADLRGADLRGADLSAALFVTQMQVNAARGDEGTGLPAVLHRPGHWGGTVTRP